MQVTDFGGNRVQPHDGELVRARLVGLLGEGESVWVIEVSVVIEAIAWTNDKST